MVWFRVDDGFADHPKVDALFDEPATAALAVAVWTLAGTWVSRHLTDGAVPRRTLRRLMPGVDAEAGAEALVRVGLWESTETGWVFVDWAEWNPTRDEVEAKRAASRERAARSNERRKAAPQKNADTPQLQRPYNGAPSRPVPINPTDPDPVPTESENPRARAALAQISDALITGVYTPPKGLERLRTVRGHLEALALHLTQDGSRSPQDISAEVLATTEAVARLIDSGDIDRDRWGSGGFLTAKSYEWARSQISGGKKKARRAMVASDEEYPPTDEDIKL